MPSIVSVSLVAALGVVALLDSARAVPITLLDNNASIVVDPAIQAAVSSWTVDGINQLNELSNWYRIGNTGPERSVHTLTLASAVQTGPNSATMLYTHSQFTLGIDFGVIGGAPGSGYSRMGETIRITNITSAPLNFHFFEYVDLDLSNTPGDDINTPLSTATLEQHDSQTIVTTGVLAYDRHEFDFYNNTIAHLSNGSTSTLNNLPGYGVSTGPGDVTWALQWDFAAGFPRGAIPPGQTVTIDKSLECRHIPEPSLLATLGSAACLGLGRRRH